MVRPWWAIKSVDVDWNAPPVWPFKTLSQLAVLLAVSSRKVPFSSFSPLLLRFGYASIEP